MYKVLTCLIIIELRKEFKDHMSGGIFLFFFFVFCFFLFFCFLSNMSHWFQFSFSSLSRLFHSQETCEVADMSKWEYRGKPPDKTPSRNWIILCVPCRARTNIGHSGEMME